MSKNLKPEVASTDVIHSVSGGKIWNPVSTVNNGTSRTKNRNRVIHLSVLTVFVIGFVWLSYAIISVQVELTGEMTADKWWYAKEESGLSAKRLFMGLCWFLLPLSSIALAINIMKTVKAALWMATAIMIVLAGIIGHAYYVGVLKDNSANVIPAWMEEKYNYRLIEFVDSEDMEDKARENMVLVEDRSTGEEKFVRYYENNERIYLAVNDDDFLAQVKADAGK